MTTDDLRALLDAAAKATPGPCCFYSWSAAKDEAWRARSRECNCDHNEYCEKCWPPEFRKGGKWDKFEPPIAAASPDTVAALARIALAAMDSVINPAWCGVCDEDIVLYEALCASGLLTTAPQEPQP